jgi:hypothetical protein
MALEAVTHIDDLVATNPVVGDDVAQGDDHIRNLKTALLNDFPNVDAACNPTPTEFNLLVGRTGTLRDSVWSAANGGMIDDIQALTDPGADRFLIWDESANAVVAAAAGVGILFSATPDIQMDINGLTAITGSISDGDFLAIYDLTATALRKITFSELEVELEHDKLLGFVANEHINWTLDDALLIHIDNIDLNDYPSMGATAPVTADEFVILDGGVEKLYAIQDMVVPFATDGGVHTYVDADMNSSRIYTAGLGVDWTLNNGVGAQGKWLFIANNGSADGPDIVGTATIQSASGLNRVERFGCALLYCVATNVWNLSGDLV